MRHVSVAQIDVADMDAAHPHLVKPVLLPVVHPLEVVGSGVAHLLARSVDNAKINESTKSSLHLRQERVEFLWVLQVRGRLCLNQQRKRGNAFREKGLQQQFGISGQPGGRAKRFDVKRVLVLVIVHRCHDDQRNDGNQRYR